MKIFLSEINESWIVDRLRDDWYKNNNEISTKNIKKSDIIWIISPWVWRKLPKRHLKSKKVICSIYHIDFNKFDKKEKEDFYKRDRFVDAYHVISNKTKDQLKTLTDKEITSIPFWVDGDLWFEIKDKDKIRSEFGFKNEEYLIGSFQRDTEGSDLKSPKLIKGPDIFLDLVQKIYKENNKTKVIITGNRRQYLIENFHKLGIPYKYFEMVDLEKLNKLYNVLDLYLVTSRVEGGPQAILECATIKTPILSTDVGIAPEILHPDSIYNEESFENAKPNVKYAFEKGKEFLIPEGMNKYITLFKKIYEN